jgi:hypothetical protein
MQNNSKSTLPQYYQNNNNAALSNTNYQNISPNIDVSGYKNQISDALNNAGNYHYTQSNNVGMDNTPYTSAINSATSNANSQASAYQSAVQKALDTYNGTSNSTPSARDIYNNSKTNAEYLSNMQKYYPQQYQQILALRQQAQDAVANGQDTSALKQQYQSALDSGKGQTTSANTSDTPQSNADYIKSMTDRINSLYDAQRNNVGLYYETGKKQAAQQYAGLRNQASVTDQQNLNKLKEAMAQQGLFNSGDNITSQTGINNQYANDLSGYNTQEQNYYDNVNNQIAQQKAQYDAQQAQAMMDMYNNADSRAFKLANLNNDQKQQAFQNAMTGINAQYGMGQDQFGNTLKGTSATYGMGRDNVSDQEYNNDSQMKADQINYGRDQDYFNNQLKAVAQKYGMDNDQVQNFLNYAKFNSSEDQRQYENSTGTNQNNYNIYNNGIKNDQSQQQITNQNNQWNQNYNTQKDEWQKTFDNSNSQWQQEFDYKKQQDALANALAQARASSGSGGSGGGRRSSGGSSRSSGRSSGSSSPSYSPSEAAFGSDVANQAANAASYAMSAGLPVMGAPLLPAAILNQLT